MALIIKGYFEVGLKHNEILCALRREHGIHISGRHLRRILRNQHLSRRNYSSPTEVVDFIDEQLKKSGHLHGYRIMHQRCLHAGLQVRVNDVRTVQKLLDPRGVEARRARCLRRREYYAHGPNFIWHLDGYDKLKPFGLCIHGCICGFSRKIIWLSVYHTNNNPQIIAGYFIESVKELGGCPRIVRGDLGTENVMVRDFQKFLRRNGNDEEQSRAYLQGASTANQRIESWWAFLRREFIHFWIEMFKDLQEFGHFDGDFLDKNLVQFCFTSVLQDELDMAVEVWNSHTIRPSRNVTQPSGRPVQMYNMPWLWGWEDKLCQVSRADVIRCSQQAEHRSVKPCHTDVYDVCLGIINRDHLQFPRDIWEGRDLYLHLRHEIIDLL